MSILAVKNRVMLLLFGSVLALCVVHRAYPRGGQVPVDTQKPIVIEVHRTQGHLVFNLEPDPAPGKDLLWGLTALVKQRGPDYPVVALVDDDAKISDIDQVPGIAAKAGFANTRTFVVNPRTGRMAEIKFCTALPISKTPSAESSCNLTK